MATLHPALTLIIQYHSYIQRIQVLFWAILGHPRRPGPQEALPWRQRREHHEARAGQGGPAFPQGWVD